MSTNSRRPIKIEEPAIITIDLTGDDGFEDHHHSMGMECRVCLDPPEVPVATLCGHVYCMTCLTRALEVCSSCPVCHQSCTFIRLYI